MKLKSDPRTNSKPEGFSVSPIFQDKNLHYDTRQLPSWIPTDFRLSTSISTSESFQETQDTHTVLRNYLSRLKLKDLYHWKLDLELTPATFTNCKSIYLTRPIAYAYYWLNLILQTDYWQLWREGKCYTIWKSIQKWPNTKASPRTNLVARGPTLSVPNFSCGLVSKPRILRKYVHPRSSCSIPPPVDILTKPRIQRK